MPHHGHLMGYTLRPALRRPAPPPPPPPPQTVLGNVATHNPTPTMPLLTMSSSNFLAGPWPSFEVTQLNSGYPYPQQLLSPAVYNSEMMQASPWSLPGVSVSFAEPQPPRPPPPPRMAIPPFLATSRFLVPQQLPDRVITATLPATSTPPNTLHRHAAMNYFSNQGSSTNQLAPFLTLPTAHLGAVSVNGQQVAWPLPSSQPVQTPIAPWPGLQEAAMNTAVAHMMSSRESQTQFGGTLQGHGPLNNGWGSGVPTGTIGLQTGTTCLQTGTVGLQTGAAQLQMGRAGLQTGTSGLPTGTSGLPTGTAGLPTGTSGLPTGTSGLPTGTAGLQTGTAGIPMETAENSATQLCAGDTQGSSKGTVHFEETESSVNAETEMCSAVKSTTTSSE